MLTDGLNEEHLECVVHECGRALCLRERERKRERELRVWAGFKLARVGGGYIDVPSFCYFPPALS